MQVQRWMRIVWPAFLTAAVLEMIVFAFIDPSELHLFGSKLALSREAIYTLAFLLFWVVTMGSSALTALLSMSPLEINSHSTPEAE